MPIAFSCSCGKAMKAKEAFAGRKVRCPRCDKVVRIPPLENEAEDLTVTPRPAMPGAGLSAQERDGGERSSMPPAAKPAARPASAKEKHGERSPMPPLAIPVARPGFPKKQAGPREEPTSAPVNAWVDQSLTQQPTRWLPGDEERFQNGIKAPREGMSGLEKSVLGFVVLFGVAASGWLLLNK